MELICLITLRSMIHDVCMFPLKFTRSFLFVWSLENLWMTEAAPVYCCEAAHKKDEGWTDGNIIKWIFHQWARWCAGVILIVFKLHLLLMHLSHILLHSDSFQDLFSRNQWAVAGGWRCKGNIITHYCIQDTSIQTETEINKYRYVSTTEQKSTTEPGLSEHCISTDAPARKNKTK